MARSIDVRQLGKSAAQSAGVFLRDVGTGVLEVSHSTLAMVGLVVVAGVGFGASQPQLRADVEQQLFGWLQARQEARAEFVAGAADLADMAEPLAVNRATAADVTKLSRPQASVAQWISRRYKVAPEPISRLVQEAWDVGQRAGVEPTLILAIMAVESSFNPFAQSTVGAQGLMQVMTEIHNKKYQPFGGNHAAFDPVTNLRVGVQVLKECIARAGGLERGLKYYVGAANLDSDGGYASKVLTEQTRLKLVASGHDVPTTTPIRVTTPPAVKPITPTPTALPEAADEGAPRPTAQLDEATPADEEARLALLR